MASGFARKIQQQFGNRDCNHVPQADFAVLILGTRSSRGVLERKEALLTTLSSYSLQHEMGRVFRGRVLCHRKSKRRQVEIGEQCLSLTEYDGRKRELQGIYELSSQIQGLVGV